MSQISSCIVMRELYHYKEVNIHQIIHSETNESALCNLGEILSGGGSEFLENIPSRRAGYRLIY